MHVAGVNLWINELVCHMVTLIAVDHFFLHVDVLPRAHAQDMFAVLESADFDDGLLGKVQILKALRMGANANLESNLLVGNALSS